MKIKIFKKKLNKILVAYLLKWIKANKPVDAKKYKEHFEVVEKEMNQVLHLYKVKEEKIYMKVLDPKEIMVLLNKPIDNIENNNNNHIVNSYSGTYKRFKEEYEHDSEDAEDNNDIDEQDDYTYNHEDHDHYDDERLH